MEIEILAVQCAWCDHWKGITEARIGDQNYIISYCKKCNRRTKFVRIGMNADEEGDFIL